MTQKLQQLGLCALLLCLAVGAGTPSLSASDASIEAPTSMIVQGSDLDRVKRLVLEVGGEVTHELRIINAVGARLTTAQRDALAELDPSLRFHEDSAVETSTTEDSGGGYTTQSQFTRLIDADLVHTQGFTGRGITVAILDTGLWAAPPLVQDSNQRQRILASYDAKRDRFSETKTRDRNGHGTHVTSIIANSEPNGAGDFNGVAPDVDMVIVRAFNGGGKGTYADVIRGIDWIVSNRQTYGIRILNLSLSARPRSAYWDDPLNQAAMAAWKAGIVVVTSAGNTGPDAMTVGVPGNVPYLITVGAMTDNYTPGDGSDDLLASFSATGPTAEGFAKPELVAPGGHLLGSMQRRSRIARRHPEFHDGANYFTMSGTSQSAAVVTGIAALMLDADPGLSPNTVKCRLMASARPAVDESGALAYSVLQQGAGLVNAYDAVHSNARGCANKRLNVRHDLAGRRHFGGRARIDEEGKYYILGRPEESWSGRYARIDGFVWSDGIVWSDAFAWSDAFVWSDASAWSDGFVWSDSFTERLSVNVWVPQE